MRLRLVSKNQGWAQEFDAPTPEALARSCRAIRAQYVLAMHARRLDRNRPAMPGAWFTAAPELELHVQDPLRSSYWMAVYRAVQRRRGLPIKRDTLDLKIDDQNRDWETIWLGCQDACAWSHKLASLDEFFSAREPLRLVVENGFRK